MVLIGESRSNIGPSQYSVRDFFCERLFRERLLPLDSYGETLTVGLRAPNSAV